ncbi:uncharacterized protein LOC144714922 isoform X2 [Wolffia australiana]
MSFWGVEVKPGKPYTHIHDNLRGSLRLSQVTLGDGQGSQRSVLQCNVGDRSPVLLCSLLPDKAECCGMDLQFEESYEVIFSVIGPRNVHLAGYFVDVASKRRPFDGDDSESFGEDIAETGSEASGSHGSQDTYESDFIDDGDLDMSSSPRRAKASAHKKKPNSDGARRRRKHLISDSDGGDDESNRPIISKPVKPPVSESEDDDDFFPISFSLSKKSEAQNLGGSKSRKAASNLMEKESKGEDKPEVIMSEKPKKGKKNQTERLESPKKEVYMKASECQNGLEDGKKDEMDELNNRIVSHSDKKASKSKKKSKTKEGIEEFSERALEKFTDLGGEETKPAQSVALEADPAKGSRKSRKKKKKIDESNAEKTEDSGRDPGLLDKQVIEGETVDPIAAFPISENSRKLKRKNERTKEDTNMDGKTSNDIGNDKNTDSIEASTPEADKGPVREKSKRKKGLHLPKN